MPDAAASKKKKPAPSPAAEAPKPAPGPRTLAIDIGGSGVKTMLLDSVGKPITDRLRAKTPTPSTPKAIIAIIADFAKKLGEFDRVSVGFPGVIKQGVVYTAANLDKKWLQFDFAGGLSKELGKPVRVANDAVVQGLGAVTGTGVELVITLGTGMGAALYLEGKPIPSLEMGHHPFRNGKTYEDELGRRALEREGRKKWNKRLGEAIDQLYRLFYYDRLYIGGGNAARIAIKLPKNATVIANQEGILGGIKLWEQDLDELRQ
ncbi:MAG TPA: ROK family protein [Terriglobales bacterium]|jgi:polyphosphate glucokinase